MDEIKSHQELLERFYYSESVVISEYSSSILKDKKELAQMVRKYASLHGLDSKFVKDI
jgi:hypothetical protein